MEMRDPVSTIREFDRLSNAHDVESLVELFTEDALLCFSPRPPAPYKDRYCGRDEIRDLFSTQLVGDFHIESKEFEAKGRSVKWSVDVSAPLFRLMGAAAVEGEGEALIEGDRIRELKISVAPDALNRSRAA